jgi:phosphodiesterase/alkaline phosphatase D-like protein
MQNQAIPNTIWITADLHYTAAHYFDPNHAAFQDFEPFWEFVSGPIHAGTWTSCALDQTFGPQVVFHSAASQEQGDNLAPSFGLQFFGHVAIDGATETLACNTQGCRRSGAMGGNDAAKIRPKRTAPFTTNSRQDLGVATLTHRF